MKLKLRDRIVIILEDGTCCTLSNLEYELFCVLKKNSGAVVARETLLHDVWGFQSMGDTRSVDMCILRLRKKIGTNRIRSVYGKGYQLIVQLPETRHRGRSVKIRQPVDGAAGLGNR